VLGCSAITITSNKYLALPARDVATWVLTPLLLGAVVLLACHLPARRAGHVEPMEVLRRASRTGWRTLPLFHLPFTIYHRRMLCSASCGHLGLMPMLCSMNA
jgi:hypothetical protein